jgi:hypothetical protein
VRREVQVKDPDVVPVEETEGGRVKEDPPEEVMEEEGDKAI